MLAHSLLKVWCHMETKRKENAMRKKCKTTAATAREKRGIGMSEKNTTDKLKCGWNWEYSFTEKELPDGTRGTLVVEYMLHHCKYGTEVVVSNYPGAHPYEDAAIEAIGDAFRDFFGSAREEGVACKEVRERLYLKAWFIDAPIDSEIVKSFATALAAINRVAVEMKLAAV